MLRLRPVSTCYFQRGGVWVPCGGVKCGWPLPLPDVPARLILIWLKVVPLHCYSQIATGPHKVSQPFWGGNLKFIDKAGSWYPESNKNVLLSMWEHPSVYSVQECVLFVSLIC